MENAISVIAATCIDPAGAFISEIILEKCNPNLLYFLWIFVALRILVPVSMPYMVSVGIGRSRVKRSFLRLPLGRRWWKRTRVPLRTVQ